MRIKLLIACSLLLLSLPVYTQEEETLIDEILSSYIELQAARSEEEEQDYLDLYQQLHYHLEHPVHLNNTNYDELARLRILSPEQINSLFEHIEKFGLLLSTAELQTIPGFDESTIRKLLPFVVIGTPKTSNTSRFEKRGSQEILVRYSRTIEKQKGYKEDGNYPGDPWKAYNRYRYNGKNGLAAGLTAEKDPGEQFFAGAQQYGYDHYSGFITWQPGKQHVFILGDYHAAFAQGLTVNTGRSPGKSADVLQIKQVSRALSPSASAAENQFLRGAGISTRIVEHWQVTAFVSALKEDARIEDRQLLSLPASGLHRTISEQKSRKQVIRHTFGGRTEANYGNLKAGFSFMGTSLQPIRGQLSGLSSYQKTRAGMDYSWQHHNFTTFGEIAVNRVQHLAFIAGIIIVTDRHLNLALLHRHYERSFDNSLNNAFSEGSSVNNERGTYLSAELTLKKSHLTAYHDLFRFPWLRYQTDAPSGGYDRLFQWKYNFNSHTTGILRITHEYKQKNDPDKEAEMPSITGITSTGIRCELNYEVNENFSLRSRIEAKEYNHSESGLLLIQDVKFHREGSRYTLVFRHAVFDTDSYNSRIYAYENDVLYAFSIPAYSGRGSRSYLMIKYKPDRHFTLWLRYDRTCYNDRKEIGSGNDLLEGSEKSGVKLQARLSF